MEAPECGVWAGSLPLHWWEVVLNFFLHMTCFYAVLCNSYPIIEALYDLQGVTEKACPINDYGRTLDRPKIVMSCQKWMATLASVFHIFIIFTFIFTVFFFVSFYRS